MSSIDCIAQSRSRIEPIKNIVNMKPNEIDDPRHTSLTIAASTCTC